MDAETHNHLENKYKRGFSVGVRWLGGRSLHTTKSIALKLIGVVFNISSPFFVADLTV
jgi:hypothetical protein